MADIIIKKVPKKYAEYMKAHLQKEHPKTKGKIKVKK
jgi:hypothetical protein